MPRDYQHHVIFYGQECVLGVIDMLELLMNSYRVFDADPFYGFDA